MSSDTWRLIVCDRCDGRGEVRGTDASGNGDWLKCSKCDGNRVVTSGPKCKTCGGSGKTYEDCGPYESGWRVCTDCTAALPKGGSGTAPPKPMPGEWTTNAIENALKNTTEPLIMRAETILERALETIRQRGKDYDNPQGERSFHELAKRTGTTPCNAVEFLMELKKVRLDATNWTHEDSLIDLQAYFALWIELKQEEARQ